MVEADRNKFLQYVETFRNQISFHYDTGYRGKGKARSSPLTDEALNLLASKNKTGRIILSRDMRISRYVFADDVIDTAVCRRVWNVPETITGESLMEAANNTIDWVNQRTKAFVGFGSELCGMYFHRMLI